MAKKKKQKTKHSRITWSRALGRVIYVYRGHVLREAGGRKGKQRAEVGPARGQRGPDPTGTLVCHWSLELVLLCSEDHGTIIPLDEDFSTLALLRFGDRKIPCDGGFLSCCTMFSSISDFHPTRCQFHFLSSCDNQKYLRKESIGGVKTPSSQ